MNGDTTRITVGGASKVASLVQASMAPEALAAQSQTYRRAASVGATPGDGVLVTGVTTAGTVTLTLANGGSAVVSVPLGSSILPFGATAAANTTAVGGSFQSLFFT